MNLPTRRSPRQAARSRRLSTTRELLDWVGPVSGVAALIPIAVLLQVPWLLAGIGIGLALCTLLGFNILLPRRRFGLLEQRRLHAYHKAEVERLATRLPADGNSALQTLEETLR